MQELPLSIAAGLNHVDCVKAILAAGADVDERCEGGAGDTALMVASSQSNKECIEILVEAGTDVNLTNSVGKTALMLMLSRNGSNECVNYLLQAGADVNIETEYGCTTMQCAAQNTNHENLQLLINAGANVNINSESTMTPLEVACYHGITKNAEVLIRSGTDVNATDRYTFKNALICAAMCGNHECVDLLIKSGADVNKRAEGLSATWGFSHAGDTALMHAVYMRDHRSVNLLIQAGADVNAFNARGECALDQATDVRCVRLLLQSGAKLYARPRRLKHLDNPSAILLYAAGQRLSSQEFLTVTEGLREVQTLCLKHLCREAIKQHLLHLDPQTHLFGRVPKLRLPKLMTEYLLYNVSLEDNEEI